MDQYRYFEEAQLRAVIERFDNVEMVLCGHVHRSMLKRWANTVVCACPSTATEIDLRLLTSAEPASHVGPRACMLHVWDERNGWSVTPVRSATSTGLIRSRDSTDETALMAGTSEVPTVEAHRSNADDVGTGHLRKFGNAVNLQATTA